jgi:hypothetical protein
LWKLAELASKLSNRSLSKSYHFRQNITINTSSIRVFLRVQSLALYCFLYRWMICLESPLHRLLQCSLMIPSVTMHAIRTTDDVQCDLDGISQWCRMLRMNLNETKCGVLKVTRNLKPVQSSYHLNNDNSANSTVICKRVVQKDLGVLITADLKWNQQVSAVCAKANRMLGFVKRSSIKMHDLRTRTALYKTLVRSRFACSSQVWSPQSVSLILEVKKVKDVQRDSSFPFRSETSYQDRLLKTGLLPLSYWHE